jgi:Coenzyme PQQ synthesis protein D (PqqD)
MNKHPKRKSNVSTRVIEGEVVVLDREEGLIHQFNPTASYVWNHLDGDLSLAAIADQLAEVFEVDSKTAVEDIVLFVSQLQELHLLEQRSPGAKSARSGTPGPFDSNHRQDTYRSVWGREKICGIFGGRLWRKNGTLNESLSRRLLMWSQPF